MPKTICHLLINYNSKNQSYTTDLLEGLDYASPDNHFVYSHSKTVGDANYTKVMTYRDQSRFVRLFKLLKRLLSDAHFRHLFRQLSIKELLKWVLLIEQNIDVLHVHHEHVIPVDVLEYFKVSEVKIIITLRGRDLLVKTSDNERARELHEKLIRATQIHCISNYLNDYLFRLYRLQAVVIYRGLELPSIENIKTNYSIKSPLQIIAAGRLVWEKGHIYLIESIARLRQKGHNIHVDIYGDGVLKEFLQFRIHQLQLQNEVILKGHVEPKTLRTIYKNYNLAVQPSVSEALSNGLIDFTLHNVPCVISDAGGMPEIIKHKANGIVFSKNDMLALDNAILDATTLDIKTLEEHNSHNRVKFSRTEEIKQLLTLY